MTILIANFSFGQETPPNKRKEVKERLRLKSIDRKTIESYNIERGPSINS